MFGRKGLFIVFLCHTCWGIDISKIISRDISPRSARSTASASENDPNQGIELLYKCFFCYLSMNKYFFVLKI